MNNQYQVLIDALEFKSFDKLEIKRFDDFSYFIIYVGGNGHVLVDKNGIRKEYRHAWQITQWLKEKYKIGSGQIEFSSFKQ
ncbi:MAG: hypothetical protein R2753_02195 [Chitinophagales bacterium]